MTGINLKKLESPVLVIVGKLTVIICQQIPSELGQGLSASIADSLSDSEEARDISINR